MRTIAGLWIITIAAVWILAAVNHYLPDDWWTFPFYLTCLLVVALIAFYFLIVKPAATHARREDQ